MDLSDSAAINKIYNLGIRPLLPTKIGVYNGVACRQDVRILDATDEFSDYKKHNIAALRSEVRTGDEVVVIGGGNGITSTIAANQVGEEGRVTVYEAGMEKVEKTKETLQLNQVACRCDVHHAIVGTLNSVDGHLGGPTELRPSELPECEVLEMDCEGAEIDILHDISISPRAVIVETHPQFGSHTESVIDELSSRGYRIETVESDPLDGDIVTATLEGEDK